MTSTTEIRLPRAATYSPIPAAAAAVLSWTRRQSIAISVVVLSATVYSIRSVYAHVTYQSNSYDLGIFAQGLKGYADGDGPYSAIKGFSLLGDHFSPITAMLAPIYLVFPTVLVLLVAQAVLIALGAAPLVSWAREALGRWQAIAVGFVFAGSFGVASAIGFDFHEVAFAVPLLSFSLSALARGRFRAAAIWAAPLVLVKEDLGATVAAIGLVLFLRGRRRLGILTAVFGVLASALEVKVLIPLANPTGHYAYAGSVGPTLNALLHPSSDLLHQAIPTLLLTLSVGVFLPTRSALALVAVPTLLWRYAGTNPAYWSMNFQYSLVLMPILVAGLVEVLVRAKQGKDQGFVRWALTVSVAVTALLALIFPIGDLLPGPFWAADPRLAAKEAAVATIPTGESVLATNKLVPQLVDKDTVAVFNGTAVQDRRPDWIVADMDEVWPDTPEQRWANVNAALANGYAKVSLRDDVIVLHRVSAN